MEWKISRVTSGDNVKDRAEHAAFLINDDNDDKRLQQQTFYVFGGSSRFHKFNDLIQYTYDDSWI
jgi:glucan phosphorylase